MSVCSPSGLLVAWVFHPNALKCPGNSLALRSEEQSVAGKGVDEERDQDGGIQGNFDHSSVHSFDHIGGANGGLKYFLSSLFLT